MKYKRGIDPCDLIMGTELGPSIVPIDGMVHIWDRLARDAERKAMKDADKATTFDVRFHAYNSKSFFILVANSRDELLYVTRYFEPRFELGAFLWPSEIKRKE